MSDYNWCHGSKCHEHKTQDRIRGVKGSKVLRTKKIAINKWNENNVWSHFCSQGCWNDFMHTHWNEFINLHPRPNALDTPIEVVKEKVETTRYNWNSDSPQREPHTYYTQKIVEINNQE